MIPGVNIPIHHLPMFVFVLIIAGVIHELGHAFAALCANVRLNGFGFFLIAIYAGAFTELETEELSMYIDVINLFDSKNLFKVNLHLFFFRPSFISPETKDLLRWSLAQCRFSLCWCSSSLDSTIHNVSILYHWCWCNC